MSKSSSLSGAGHVLGSRYAVSLIAAANQAGVLDSVEADMRALNQALSASSDLSALLDSPVSSKDQQFSILQALAKKAGFQTVSVNFLGVLASNGRLSALQAILQAFFRAMETRHGIIEAKVVSAFPLTEGQQKTLAGTLASKTGKTVRLDLQLDKSLLGGMIVTVGSQMIDDSLKTRLEQLKQTMIGQKAA